MSKESQTFKKTRLPINKKYREGEGREGEDMEEKNKKASKNATNQWRRDGGSFAFGALTLKKKKTIRGEDMQVRYPGTLVPHL